MPVNQSLCHTSNLIAPFCPLPLTHSSFLQCSSATASSLKLGRRWKEYMGLYNWEGLLDPLDDVLRSEILRYGQFVQSTYVSFDFDPFSPTYATCLYPKSSLFSCSGVGQTGYRITKYLRATCGVQLPRWIYGAPSWMGIRSCWIGYVAVCQDKEEIARLGRRDVAVVLRGTATCLEWLENLRANLTDIKNDCVGSEGSAPMVESGFLSLYTSRTTVHPSLQEMVREEIAKVIQSYGSEPLSLTITGHSLGAALATLIAYDITATFDNAPMVTVISFAGPRVGDRCFRRELEKSGTRVLRIVNSDDLITKVPGFVADNDDVADKENVHVAPLPTWLQKMIEGNLRVYADVGKELRLSSRKSPYFSKFDFATCHDMKTYLHLVNEFVSSSCPFRVSKTSDLSEQYRENVYLKGKRVFT